MAAGLALSGCVPLMHSYYKAEYPGATYFGEACLGVAGAPSVAYFPYEGIFLSVAVVADEPATIIVGFHIPAGNRMQILEKSVAISYGTTQPITMEKIWPTDLRGGNPDPEEFREIPSTYGKEDYFGELTGETMGTAYKTYLFKANFDETKANAGTIGFPEFRINGKIYKGPVVPFKKSTSFEISPINC